MKTYAWAVLWLGLWAVGAGVPEVRAQTSPPAVELKKTYANPVRAGTAVPFTLGGELFTNGHRPRVSLKIYNVLAQVVAVPVLEVTGETLDNLELVCADPSGCTYTAFWDGKVANAGQRAREVASGVYLYQLIVDGARYTKKMVIMK